MRAPFLLMINPALSNAPPSPAHWEHLPRGGDADRPLSRPSLPAAPGWARFHQFWVCRHSISRHLPCDDWVHTALCMAGAGSV